MTAVVEDVENDNTSAAADVSTLSQLLGGGDHDDDDHNPAPASTCNQKERRGYEHRLLTFRAATYCAKPACLSPLLCARFGWENADKDMLVCSSCSSALAVMLNLRLATNEKLVEAYRQQIVSNHKPSCHFGMTVEQFVRFDDAGGGCNQKGDNKDDDKKENEGSNDGELEIIVPTYMTSVLPEDCLQVMEHPAPSGLLRPCVQEIVKCLQNMDTAEPKWKYPKLELPNEIVQFRSSVGLLGIGTEDVSVMALAILGWKPLESLQDSVPVVSLGCPLCFAFMELRLETPHGSEGGEGEGVEGDTDSVEGNTDDFRPSKRQRLARYCNPLSAHRYYCPYVTGFPKTILSTTKPVWKTIFERLCREKKSGDGHEKETTTAKGETTTDAMSTEENDIDWSICQIRAILRAGIAPKTVDLSGDVAEEKY